MKIIHMGLAVIIMGGIAVAGGDIVPTEKPVVVEPEKDWGEIFGQERTFYIDRSYSGTLENNRNALTTGGYIGYKTPDFGGLTAVIAAYGTYGFPIHSNSATDLYEEGGEKLASQSYDPSLTGRNFENYAFIGQAYLNYAFGNTNIKGGRMRLDTPLAGADDARMLPNLFEAAVLSNTDIENTTLIAAHVFRETVGTFGNIYGGGALGLTSGYGLGINEALSGDFANMGTVALGSVDAEGNFIDNETDGVTALAALYTGIDGLKVQAWDYIAWDILNAVYLSGDYTMSINESAKVKLSAQYINESDIGDMLAGSVDTNYLAGKITGIYGDFSAYFAYSVTGDSDTDTGGNVITPWGGMPAYTQGMVSRHQFFANTDTWKVAAAYNMKEYGIKASVYHVEFDVGVGNIYVSDNAWSASESGWDVQYSVASIKGLNLRVRANYPRDFKEGLDWDEYRVIVNYNF